MAAHAYWRIRLTANNGGGAVSIAELQMYDSVGTYLCIGGTAFSDDHASSFVAANAFDSNMGTFWASNHVPSSGSPSLLGYQFASPVDVACVRLTPRTDLLNQAPTAFTIQYSDDGTSYTDTVSASSVTWDLTTIITRSWAVGTPAAGSYVGWRINISAVNGGGANAAGIATLEWRSSVGGSQLASSAITQYTIESSEFSGNNGYLAYDTNPATAWGSSSAPPQWLGYSFAQAIAMRQLVMVVRNDGSFYASQSPSAFTVQGSNDGGITWTTVATVTPASWTSAGQSQTFAFGTVGAGLFRSGALSGIGTGGPFFTNPLN